MQAVRTRTWDARLIAEVGVTIALAGVLHMVKLWQMPQGGSITQVQEPQNFPCFRSRQSLVVGYDVKPATRQCQRGEAHCH